MNRPVCALLLLASCSGLVAASCGTVASDTDPHGRPLDFEYIVGAVFAPSCGQTQCHSRFHQAGGLVFDNPEDARVSLLIPNTDPNRVLLKFDSSNYDPAPTDIAQGYRPTLIRWLTEIDPLGLGIGRMPFDAPIPARDLELLRTWIHVAPEHEGDPPGATARGAQCNPANYGGLACNGDDLVRCNDDFNFGEPEMTCANYCQVTDTEARCQ